jgi:hypothetical protein
LTFHAYPPFQSGISSLPAGPEIPTRIMPDFTVAR